MAHVYKLPSAVFCICDGVNRVDVGRKKRLRTQLKVTLLLFDWKFKTNRPWGTLGDTCVTLYLAHTNSFNLCSDNMMNTISLVLYRPPQLRRPSLSPPDPSSITATSSPPSVCPFLTADSCPRLNFPCVKTNPPVVVVGVGGLFNRAVFFFSLSHECHNKPFCKPAAPRDGARNGENAIPARRA